MENLMTSGESHQLKNFKWQHGNNKFSKNWHWTAPFFPHDLEVIEIVWPVRDKFCHYLQNTFCVCTREKDHTASQSQNVWICKHTCTTAKGNATPFLAKADKMIGVEITFFSFLSHFMVVILTMKCDDAFAVVLSMISRFDMAIFTKNLQPFLGVTDLPSSIFMESRCKYWSFWNLL